MEWGNIYTVSGIIGMALIMLGLWRTSSGRWHHSNALYELDTIIGASLIIMYQLHVKAYVTLPINVFLVIVCFRGLSSYAERYAKHYERRLAKRHKRTTRKH